VKRKKARPQTGVIRLLQYSVDGRFTSSFVNGGVTADLHASQSSDERCLCSGCSDANFLRASEPIPRLPPRFLFLRDGASGAFRFLADLPDAVMGRAFLYARAGVDLLLGRRDSDLSLPLRLSLV